MICSSLALFQCRRSYAFLLSLFLSANLSSQSVELDKAKAMLVEIDSLYNTDLKATEVKLSELAQYTKENGLDSLYCLALFKRAGLQQDFSRPDSVVSVLERFINHCGKENINDYVMAQIRMSEAYLFMGEVEQAKKFLDLAIAEESKIDKTSQLSLYLSVSRFHNTAGDHKSQLEYAKRAFKISKDLGTERNKSMIASYLGVAFNQLGMSDSSIFWQQKSIEYAQKAGNKRAVAIGYTNLFDTYFNLRKFDQAEVVYDKARALAEEIGLNDLLNYLDDGRAELKYAQGEYKEAYEFLKKTFDESRERSSEEHVRAINDLKVKYDTELKEQEILKLEQEGELQQLRLERASLVNRFSVAIVILVLLVLAAGIWFYRKLQKTNKELDKANATKDKFFAIIAHDLRGSATSFQGIGQMLNAYAKDGKTERIEKLSGMIDESADRLNRLLDNLLKWALTQLNTVPYHPENVKLSQIVDEVIQQVEMQSSAKQIRLEKKLKEELEAYADADGLRLITRNLINNAIKFSNAGGAIIVEARKLNDRIELEVKDTGVGMDEKTLEGLFEIKESTRSMGTAGEKGSGLGLMLVKEFVKLNKGDIQVVSEAGKGSTFKVYLPIAA